MQEQMPMPEGGAPQAEAAPQEGGAGEFQKLAGNVLKGMALIGEGLEGQGAPQEVLQGLMGVMQQFEDVIASLGGGGGAPQEAAPSKGKGAVPIQESQGRPASPAGV